VASLVTRSTHGEPWRLSWAAGSAGSVCWGRTAPDTARTRQHSQALPCLM